MEVTLRTCQSVPFYACGGFDPSVCAHGFSTRLGGVSPAPWDSLNLGANRGDAPERVAENFRRFCSAAGADPAALVKNHQVHGDLVRPVTRRDVMSSSAEPGVYEADGPYHGRARPVPDHLFRRLHPVLLLDPVRRCAAAVHAGWRGTALGIAAPGRPPDAGGLRLPPGTYPGRHRAWDLPLLLLTRDDVPGALRDGLGSQAETCIRPAEDGRWHVDLKGANALWLRRAGLSPEHIALCPECTACRTDRFWSHRVMGERRGSMAAIIQLL